MNRPGRLVIALIVLLPLIAVSLFRNYKITRRNLLLKEAIYTPTPYPAPAKKILDEAYPKLKREMAKGSKIYFTSLAIPQCGTWAYAIAERKEGGSVGIEFSGHGVDDLRPTGGILEDIRPPSEVARERLKRESYLCEPD